MLRAPARLLKGHRHFVDLEMGTRGVPNKDHTDLERIKSMTTEKKGLLERSREAHPEIARQFAKVLKELGIEGKPIPARELQARMRAGGMRPEDNELSRGIIEMRDE